MQGLGREQATLFLTNNDQTFARELIENCTYRNGIEDSLGSSVNCFHLDCLCNEVRLNVDLDVTLRVLADGCYRWLANQLKGEQKSQAKLLYRRFVETSGQMEVTHDGRLLVTLDQRCHNPNLKEAAWDRQSPPIPWLKNLRIAFDFQ